MSMSKFFAAIFVLGLSSFALAQDLSAEERDRVLEQLRHRKKQHVESQDGDAELKARILEKVREKLAADRSALLQRIERIIDEELGKPAAKKPTTPDGDSVPDIERKMRVLEEEKEKLAADMAK